MKTIPLAGALKGTAMATLVACSATNAATVFTENFPTTTVLADKPNSYLGGYYGSHLSFGEWVRSGPTITLPSESLQVSSDSGFRSAAVLLSPTLFPSAGNYKVTFDITTYSGDANDTATVSVWSGSGYDLTHSSGSALILNSQTGQLQALGSASSSLLASSTYSAAGNAITLDFSYDGSSTIALFFAATTGGYPFPTVRYDNVSISNATVVPEPTAVAVLSFALAGGLLRRRRSA
ncbi:PEP-CTERM sorting domain-containing protein [Luteolibacter arcticus]|uniref:PEP-CTERM sorting domain-containing protein n=1 Tax=Luteolibacter arcticus TaxID=1581411 RepID=A0ABT3GDQ2_9BACT|nr:PEP-CTERM sorting domain-containing protein [Luteolibacter arcticus]MCW1921749.1 PEP-CTERM sorting domain-containing protein [Luteolibacter arcticus]